MKKHFFPHDGKEGHKKYLDGLRGIAVLIVLLGHAAKWNFFSHPLLDFSPFSHLGVLLFFILSGYLLDKQIISALISRKANSYYWLNYLFRRFLRIFPMLFLSLVLYYLINKFFFETFVFEKSDIWQHLTLTAGKSFYWSIPVEFKYYIISPILIVIFSRIFQWSLKPIFIVIFGIICFAFIIGLTVGHVYLSTFKYISIFLAGTSIALMESFAGSRLNYNFKYLAATGIILILLMNPDYFKYFFDIEWYLRSDIKIPIYSFLLTIVFLSVHVNNGVFRKIAELNFIRFFGSISYSLYLLHWACGMMVSNYSSGINWLDYMLYLVSAVILATIGYSLVELPLSRINIKNFMNISPISNKL